MQTITSEQNTSEERPYTFTQRVGITVGITIFLILLTLLLGFSFDILLLITASLLIALPLRAAARWLSKKTGWKEGISLVMVALVTLGLFVGMIWIFSTTIGHQFSDLKEGIPKAVDNFQQKLSQNEMGSKVLEMIPSESELMQGGSKWMNRATGVLSSTFGTIADLYVIFFLAIFIAAQPRLYREGIILLIPKKSRNRAGEVLDKVGETLVKWLMGQLFSMAVVGVLSFIGLWALGIPLAGALALFAALVTFIPNIGPIFALIPAVLFALMDGPEKALYVILIYVGIQAIESNVLTPIVQKRMIDIPPALVLISQLIIGLFTGVLGLILATPLMAMVMVMVKMLYIQDTLKDDSVEV
ncbi:MULTISPECIES: AI-2E family transporter [unclassified Siphonobacter]|uniref:AI-2E family transporter n=1 Tax=unclassified Siphonobacter TaxID=2635712 RepID=UPI0027864CD8|nr:MULTISPECIES: AI-2E family transporter [unclassified Siphonobacter]MDQ1086222.1 putative PurR-regulated permease PerM [Siphonobacter sp. SORGH_AS_1065]MDR6196504.1 putative PurR-regulated permease PerM [Siphonobacter sp. SORGH_AS_0500]